MIFFKKKRISDKELKSLQNKLEALRVSIREKRDRARKAFDELLIAIERTKGIEGLEHLSEKLAELGQVFTAGQNILSEKPEKEIVAFEKTEEELALEDILAAMESLLNAHERKEKIKAALLKEELKRMMIARYAQSKNHPGDWTKVVTSGDLIELLQNARFEMAVSHFESPKMLLEESLRLAQESVSMRDLKAFMPNQSTDAKGINANTPNQNKQQSV